MFVKAGRTKQLIISVAADLFAHHGVRKTTMEAIADKAGKGRRTVYMYFSNKAEVYNAVVDDEIDHILKSLKEILGNDGEISAVLHEYALQRYNNLYTLLKRNPLLVRDFSQCHNRIERLRERLNGEELKIVTVYFRQLTRTYPGKFSESPEMLAIMFMNLLRGNDRLMILKESSGESKERVSAACELFLNGAVCM